MRRILTVITAITGIVGILRWLGSQSADADKEAGHLIRDAGPGNMLNPPVGWDITDQVGDESFPASDPPGGY